MTKHCYLPAPCTLLHSLIPLWQPYEMKMMLKINMKAKDKYEYEDNEVLVEDESEE